MALLEPEATPPSSDLANQRKLRPPGNASSRCSVQRCARMLRAAVAREPTFFFFFFRGFEVARAKMVAFGHPNHHTRQPVGDGRRSVCGTRQ